MIELLHPRKEIYNAAYDALKRIPNPEFITDTARISVPYEMEDKTVYYTVEFRPIFDGDSRKFVEWHYHDMEMSIKNR